MRTGADALKKAVKEATTAFAGFSGKLQYCNWKPDETKVIRFLTDVPDIITVDFYEYIVDSTGKTQNFIVYPDLHDGVGEDYVLKYGGKMHEKGLVGELIDPIPRTRTVAIAVMREEAPKTVDGKTVIDYQDVIEEIDVQGEKYPARQFVIIKQAHKNFWQPLVGFWDEYETLCDRDYKITRVGTTTDTTYQIVPKREDPNFNLEEHYAFYGYGKPRDEKDPDRFLFCPQTLPEWAEYYGGEERVKFFLTGQSSQQQTQQTQKPATTSAAATPSTNGAQHTPSGVDEFHKDTTHNPEPESDEAQAVSPPSTTDFSALRNRLERHKKT